jgi:hypothetical protein
MNDYLMAVVNNRLPGYLTVNFQKMRSKKNAGKKIAAAELISRWISKTITWQ